MSSDGKRGIDEPIGTGVVNQVRVPTVTFTVGAWLDVAGAAHGVAAAAADPEGDGRGVGAGVAVAVAAAAADARAGRDGLGRRVAAPQPEATTAAVAARVARSHLPRGRRGLTGTWFIEASPCRCICYEPFNGPLRREVT
jgi:hypothetical protein